MKTVLLPKLVIPSKIPKDAPYVIRRIPELQDIAMFVVINYCCPINIFWGGEKLALIPLQESAHFGYFAFANKLK